MNINLRLVAGAEGLSNSYYSCQLFSLSSVLKTITFYKNQIKFIQIFTSLSGSEISSIF